MSAAFKSRAFDPQHYLKSRPEYSQELINLLYAWHTEASSSKDNNNQDDVERFDDVVDLGCGPAQLARLFAQRFKHVYAVDPSDVMIQAAKDLCTSIELPKGHSISFHLGKAEETGLQAQSVDAIVAGSSAHWMAWNAELNGAKVWNEFARILRPHGSVAFIGYNWPYVKGCDKINKAILEIPTLPDRLGPYFDVSDKHTPHAIAQSFYDLIPHPKGQAWDEQSTCVLKFGVTKEHCPGYTGQQDNDPKPFWVSKALQLELEQGNQDKYGKGAEEMMCLHGPRRILIDLIRSTSGYVRYLEDHPEEKAKVAEEKDAIVRWLNEYVDDQFNWSEEAVIVFPFSLFLARRSGNSM